MRFQSKGNYNELIYYFMVTNDKNEPTFTTFLRSEAKQYIPKSLQGQRLILPKINELFNTLITMKKPIEFIMETHEVLSQEELKRFDPLIETIQSQGYNIKFEDFKKDGNYFWRFSTKTKEKLDEEILQEFFNRDVESLIEEMIKEDGEMIQRHYNK